MEHIADTGMKAELTKQDKTVDLFKFIRGMNELKQKLVLRVSDYPWWKSISSFPEDPENIRVYFRDRVEEDDSEQNSNILLSVHKPEFQNCPKPEPVLLEWLEPGWEDYRRDAVIREFILRPLEQFQVPEEKSDRVDEENKTFEEQFSDDPQRAELYQAWQTERAEWAKKQKLLAKTRNLFTDLYKACIDLDRDSESMELVVADGFLRDRRMPELDHPILTRRVKIRYDAVENTIYVEDGDVETELYTSMFQSMAEVNLSSVNQMNDALHENDYHPLDRNDLPVFLKAFVHQLTSESLYSEDGIPENWYKKERLLMYRDPCYILRRRMDGAMKAIEQIIRHVEETGEVPAPIADIVEGGKIKIEDDSREVSVEEQLAAVGGESVDILLSKEANREQLEIAKRIERYNAVLVQGPPGTGKTHTIANLMGHFLAQGKSVLVTSHTKKALSVLKEKVAPGLQNLCVSMLDDSNVDMEKSIDGITGYMSRYTSFDLRKAMDALGQQRSQIIRELADVRKKMFAMINQECSCIILNGEEISPSAAAAYVQENSETLSYIPGEVKLYEPLPLSFSELAELYHSNDVIRKEDEAEFDSGLPEPTEIMTPSDFEDNLRRAETAQTYINDLAKKNHWDVRNLPEQKQLLISAEFGSLTLEYPSEESEAQLKACLSELPKVEKWMQHCAVDGRKGESYRQLWQRLIGQIRQTCSFAEKYVLERFGKTLEILNKSPDFPKAVQQLQEKYAQGARISKLTLMFNKQLETALSGALIDGEQPRNEEDCQLILHTLELDEMRRQCARYWDELMAKHGTPQFTALDSENPERVAANYIPLIQRYLDWFGDEYKTLTVCMEAAGLPCDVLFQSSPLDSELTAAEKILSALDRDIPALCDLFDAARAILRIDSAFKRNQSVLQSGKRVRSAICGSLLLAQEGADVSGYRNGCVLLEAACEKAKLAQKRKAYLERLEPVAPQWAEAIRSRANIHGQSAMPSDIEEAWKWKQYCGIIAEITAEPFADLQARSLELSREYRSITAEFAEKSAWYHLLHRTEHDITMKQALIGWKQTVKRIGKGTGKNAPIYRAKARELMAKCQSAVPGWIMPVGKALESLNPCTNRFDIIIIDEASQSDISSLAILYMGRKLVIVGDDKQVSPMGVGVQIEKLNNLKAMYIEGKIPNDHLYDMKTSVYDVAATTFQPLMLHEHFRCVPEIIGFSNWLSYDFQIKPLRDSSSSNLLPAVVHYRVADGQRIGDTNPEEARAIVSLMRACMAQPEYDGKTFGVISLQGDDQVKKLQEEIFLHIDTRQCNERKILCGNASNFQGDERDVIFLSLVDCANGGGPVSKRGFGPEDSYRKRYNVAASRARDQLWVVDSLDPAVDLKPGDIRKMLIDYAIDPEAPQIQNEKIEEKAESPFEAAVARSLTARGYHLVQQWKVGAYRLDMVAVCGMQKAAIECDGERWHSGEEKIREDMERQTILERLGWRFIRIRGSEYYRDPDKTINRVIDDLTVLGINPEAAAEAEARRDTELLSRVKQKAAELLEADKSEVPVSENEVTVAAALDPKSMCPRSPDEKTSMPKGLSQEPARKIFATERPAIEPAAAVSDRTLIRKEMKPTALEQQRSTQNPLPERIEEKTAGSSGSVISEAEPPEKDAVEVLSGEFSEYSEEAAAEKSQSCGSENVMEASAETQNIDPVGSSERRILFSAWLTKEAGNKKAQKYKNVLDELEAFCRENQVCDDLFGITDPEQLRKVIIALRKNDAYSKVDEMVRYHYFTIMRFYERFLETGEASEEAGDLPGNAAKDG